jgi:hypothetical protein
LSTGGRLAMMWASGVTGNILRTMSVVTAGSVDAGGVMVEAGGIAGMFGEVDMLTP